MKNTEKITILSTNEVIRNKGATFCQVANSKQDNQGNPAITLGNQKWKGKTPIFSINPLKITIKPKSCLEEKSTISQVNNKL